MSILARQPGCVLPKLFHTLSLFIEGADWGIFKLWNCCSATATALMCCEHCFGHVSKTQHPTSCYEENELHPSQPQCSHEDVKRGGELDVWSGTDRTGFPSLKNRRLRGNLITVFPCPKIGADTVEVLSLQGCMVVGEEALVIAASGEILSWR